MNLTQFLEHWALAENPFKGEEARNDTVFAKVGLAVPGSAASSVAGGAGKAPMSVTHSDFEKVLGDPARPSSAIVFGEKGSGKTAIRLQLEDRIANWNAAHPNARVLLVPYDSLNPFLDAFHHRAGSMVRSGKESIEQSLARIRLHDHLDAILALVVPRVVDTILASGSGPAGLSGGIDLGEHARKTARRMDESMRWDLLLLQSIYDRPEQAATRSGELKWALRLGRSGPQLAWSLGAMLGWIPAAALAVWNWVLREPGDRQDELKYVVLALVALWLVPLIKVLVWDKLRMRGAARRVRKSVRMIARTESSLASSLSRLGQRALEGNQLPVGESEDTRYEALQRLKRILAVYGYAAIVCVIDRVDEPSIVSGSVDRMKSVVWPMLNNKFLQQEGIGFKLLLPIELRHALFKESSAFFQEARLDKQHLVERLTWTGAMLFDLCEARLRACLMPNVKPIGLLDLFAEDVTRQDVVDALDQMHQPRDAFKLLYDCLSEHCSNVTAEQGAWRIARATLETVRKRQSERVQQLYRGIRPA